MPIYKCPQCGRENIEILHSEIDVLKAGFQEEGHKPGEAHCKDCGWVGTVADLKPVG